MEGDQSQEGGQIQRSPQTNAKLHLLSARSGRVYPGDVYLVVFAAQAVLGPVSLHSNAPRWRAKLAAPFGEHPQVAVGIAHDALPGAQNWSAGGLTAVHFVVTPASASRSSPQTATSRCALRAPVRHADVPKG